MGDSRAVSPLTHTASQEFTRTATAMSSQGMMSTVSSMVKPNLTANSEVPQLGELGPLAVVFGEDDDEAEVEERTKEGMWTRLKGHIKPGFEVVDPPSAGELTLSLNEMPVASTAAQSGLRKVKGALGWKGAGSSNDADAPGGGSAMTRLGAIALNARINSLAERVSQLKLENENLRADNAELKEQYEGEKRRAEDLLDVCMKSGMSSQGDWATRQRTRRGGGNKDDDSVKKNAKAVVDMKIQLQNEQRAMKAKLQRFDAVEGSLRDMEGLMTLDIAEIRQDMEFFRTTVGAMQAALPAMIASVVQCVESFATGEKKKSDGKAPRSIHTQCDLAPKGADEKNATMQSAKEKEATIQSLQSDVRRLQAECEQRDRHLQQVQQSNTSLQTKIEQLKAGNISLAELAKSAKEQSQQEPPPVRVVEVPPEAKDATLEDLLSGIEDFAKGLSGARRDEILALLMALKKVQEDIAEANDIALPGAPKDAAKPISSHGSRRERPKLREFEVQRSERHALLDLYPDVVDRMQKAEEERKKRWAAKVAEFRSARAMQLEKLLYLLRDEVKSMAQPGRREPAGTDKSKVGALHAYIKQLAQWRETFARETGVTSPTRSTSPTRAERPMMQRADPPAPLTAVSPLHVLKIDNSPTVQRPNADGGTSPQIGRFAVSPPPHTASPGVHALAAVSPQRALSPGTGYMAPVKSTPKLPHLLASPFENLRGTAIVRDQVHVRGKR